MRKSNPRAWNAVPWLAAALAGVAACCFATAGYAADNRVVGKCTSGQCKDFNTCGFGGGGGNNPCAEPEIIRGDPCFGKESIAGGAQQCNGAVGICLDNFFQGPYICTTTRSCACLLNDVGVLTCRPSGPATTNGQAGNCSPAPVPPSNPQTP